jgi:uncharacterized glyoxalase superfamily protein PhnB
MRCHFILYVADQAASTQFYSISLGSQPTLDTPGMTEFQISDNTILGLMPAAGANRLFGTKIHIVSLDEKNSSRCEIYLIVPDAARHHSLALAAGATELSPLIQRDWGHRVAYSLDPDHHVLAFAEADDPLV